MRIMRIQSGHHAEGAAQQEHFQRENDYINLTLLKPKAEQAELVMEESLEKNVEQINRAAEIFNRKLHFRIHESTNRVMVQVLNSDTGDVISEIPSEKLLDVVAHMEELVGAIFDKRF